MCLEDGKQILDKDLKSYKVHELIKGRTLKSFEKVTQENRFIVVIIILAFIQATAYHSSSEVRFHLVFPRFFLHKKNEYFAKATKKKPPQVQVPGC